MNESKKNTADPDRFWDLSDLVPKRKASPRATSFPSSTSATEVVSTVRTDAAAHVVSDMPLTERFVPPHTAQELNSRPEPLCSYRPTGALIREVRIYPWRNEYVYYEQFRRHAEHFATRTGTACPEVDFFSYMPQYTQLNRQQMEYYLWWRENFQNEVCLPAAYSYLLLYLYELINLDEKHRDPQKGQESMVRLWLSYRERFPRLDALVREWLCDYSLLHQLPPPRLDPAAYRLLLSGCRLKEFYVPYDTNGEGNDEALSAAVLLFCNNYDYTKSKFYRPDTKDDMDRVLRGAIREALCFLREQKQEGLTGVDGISTVSRDLFSGAVCSYRLKRRVEVDYTSFSHTHELRYIMTDVLKYAENALRARRGMKSRLSYYAVSVPLRDRLDAYLERVLPLREATRSASKKPEVVPDYERRYDLPVTPVSPQRAAEIEAESWATTQRLIEAFGESEEIAAPEALPPPVVPIPDVPVPSEATLPAPESTDTAFAAALGDLVPFLSLALAKDGDGQRSFARSKGLMPDAIVDKINTVAGDFIGDIVLEEENGIYVIIEDYLEFLTEQGVLI